MNQPPLNPDALNLRAYDEALLVFKTVSDLYPVQAVALKDACIAYAAHLAVAQPEVNTFEESDALPVGSVVLDVDGNTARRFPDGWRTTVVEADGRVWLSGHMEDPDLPARVLYRPEVKP